MPNDPKPPCARCGRESHLRCCRHMQEFCVDCQPTHHQPGQCYYVLAPPLRLRANPQPARIAQSVALH